VLAIGKYLDRPSSEENAESGFAYLGQQGGKLATFVAGMHWLSNCSKPWLLVIDNADDLDMDISKFFPTRGKGHILITTINLETVLLPTIGEFHFRGMGPEEAITLLLKFAYVSNEPEHPNVQSRELAQSIASELGYLALALAPRPCHNPTKHIHPGEILTLLSRDGSKSSGPKTEVENSYENILI
jgi:hypothetical protein